MIVRVTVAEVASTPVIAHVELTGLASVGVTNTFPTYLVEINTDTELNKLLNDYSHIGVHYVDAGRTKITLTFNDAQEAVGTRTIPTTQWVTKVRPAWFRAATTTNLFNA